MTTIEQFLGAYSSDIAELAAEMRRFVHRLVPDAQEKLHTGWKSITYSHSRSFCSIIPHAKWVNLQFHAGVRLPDPRQRLTGTGKAMRHVRVASADDLDDSLADLIRAAATLAAG